jgi:hypothetical protein
MARTCQGQGTNPVLTTARASFSIRRPLSSQLWTLCLRAPMTAVGRNLPFTSAGTRRRCKESWRCRARGGRWATVGQQPPKPGWIGTRSPPGPVTGLAAGRVRKQEFSGHSSPRGSAHEMTEHRLALVLGLSQGRGKYVWGWTTRHSGGLWASSKPADQVG